jgi:hypothetical protein
MPGTNKIVVVAVAVVVVVAVAVVVVVTPIYNYFSTQLVTY